MARKAHNISKATDFFNDIPMPMWVFDPDSLRFLEVNRAAIATLGYSRDTFLSMTIADIRPPEDVPALRKAVSEITEGAFAGGIWRIKANSGAILHADFHWRTIEHNGAKAVLAAVRDVTRLLELEKEQAELLEREKRARAAAERSSRQFQAFFEAIPGKVVVLSPGDHRIVAVSDDFLNSTKTRREDITGRPLYEVFPDAPDMAASDGTQSLHGTLVRVEQMGATEFVPVERYPIPIPGDPHGGFEDRYWSSIYTPVKGAEGRTEFIVLRVEDVTDMVMGSAGGEADPTEHVTAVDGYTHVAIDVLLRAEELRQATARLQQQDVNLRMAQRLLGLGVWRLDMNTGVMGWSDNLYELFGVAPEDFGHSFEALLDFVHPDDRADLVARFEAFAVSGETSFSFEHRILRPDGAVLRIRGAGELTDMPDGQVLAGVVQDVTEAERTRNELLEASRLARLAGDIASLGGWSVELNPERIIWSRQTAAIHEEPEGTSPPLERAMEYYAPEHRERIARAFARCVGHGEPFDELARLVTAKGNRVWVRAIGEPEYDADGTIVAVQGAFQDVSELVAARDEAQELSQRLVRTLENMSDAVFTLDTEWRFSFLNNQAEKLLGRSRAELTGRVIWDEFPDAAGSAFEHEYVRAITTGRTSRFTEYYPPLEAWFEVSAYPGPDGLGVYFRDVTEHRERTERLRLLETAVSRQNDILLITEAAPIDAPDGPKIVYVNDAFNRSTGYSPEEVLGKSPRILQGPRTQRHELNRIRKAMESRHSVRGELINYTKSGAEFWVELDIVPMSDDTGRTTHFVAIQRDITERKRAEGEIRASEERFRFVSQATHEIIWDWDIVAGNLWYNDNFELQFGFSAGSAQEGKAIWSAHIHPDDHDRVSDQLDDVICGDATSWQDEYRLVKADGGSATVLDRGLIIRDDSGKAIRMVGSLVDVTQDREADNRLRQSQRMEAIGQLTGGVAHDFNNLLTIILGNAELLGESLKDPQQRAMADMTATAAERGAELTNRLLAFARQQPLDPRSLDLNRLVAAMDGMLRRTLTAAISIEIACEDGLWPTEVDAGQIEVALLNLAINSRDAMPEGGKLTIETANVHLDAPYSDRHADVCPGKYVVLTVTDTGTGMSEETRERAFEPFFTTKTEGKGSGLGLSMVYGFVKQSGGHIKVYSEPGEGTAVKLYFPRSNSGTSPETAEQGEPQVRGGSEHILVVEDDDQVRTNLITQLIKLGYRITDAADGATAMAILENTSDVDLLLTDVVMPGGMSGRQLADAAQALQPGLKVLFTSGYTENAIMHHGRLDQGVQLLSKPYRRQDLAAKVRFVLES